MTHNQAVGKRSGTLCSGDNIAATDSASSPRTLYQRLVSGASEEAVDANADAFLRGRLRLAGTQRAELPHNVDELEVDELEHWVARRADETGAEFRQYLQERRAGAPRRFFRHRAHALGFLRASAPTKLVDGAWLYGLAKHWHDIRLRDLMGTFLDELGDGFASHNHVAVYTRLLAEHECDDWLDLPERYFLQGTTQLALGSLADHYLPEVLGYNLGYEQPPLHMLITAHELSELGIDPWYFRLHITVDNAASGHALLAARSVRRAMPLLGDAQLFWQRVRAGLALSQLGPGAVEIIDDFDLDAEVVRIFRNKARIGRCMHNDRMRFEGRPLNDWLQEPGDIPALLEALQRHGWIVRGRDPEQSRFWRALVGANAPMCGVFTRYERQVIEDWISGEESRESRGAQDLQAIARDPARATAARTAHPDSLSEEERRLFKMLDQTEHEDAAMQRLFPLLAPHAHATPVGLLATRIYRHIFHGKSLLRALAEERLSIH